MYIVKDYDTCEECETAEDVKAAITEFLEDGSSKDDIKIYEVVKKYDWEIVIETN